MKEIYNIVFYKFYGEKGAMQQACIFFTDGSVKNTFVEEGIDAVCEFAKQNNITSIEELMNNITSERNIYFLSGKELELRYEEFTKKNKKKKGEEKMKVITNTKTNRDPLTEYENSGYGKNAFGWYFNPYIDEYDENYDPTKDPLFGGMEDKDLEAMENYYNSGYGKNSFGWYFNPNIDEYEENYNPVNDPLFNTTKVNTISETKQVEKNEKTNEEKQEQNTVVIPTIPVFNKQNNEVADESSKNIPVFNGNDVEESNDKEETPIINFIPSDNTNENTPIFVNIDDDMKENNEEEISEPKEEKEDAKEENRSTPIVVIDRNKKQREEKNPYSERKAATINEETPTTKVIVEEVDLNDNDQKEEKTTKKPGFFKRLAARITLFVLVIATGLGLYSCANHVSKNPEDVNGDFIIGITWFFITNE